MLKNKLRLKYIKLKGFRSFKDEVKVDLDYDVIVFYGGVGAGKTSILEAIEYALYGTTYEVAEIKGIRVDDLVNDFSDELSVTLCLTDGRHEYLIERRKRKGVRGSLKIFIDGQEKYRGVAAESFIKELIGGLTYYDFSRFILVRKPILENIVAHRPSERTKALDRLFGLTILEELSRSKAYKVLENRLFEVENRLRELESKVKIAEDINRYITKIKELEEKIQELKEEKEKLKQKQKKLTTLIKELDKKAIELEHIRADKIACQLNLDELKRQLEREYFISEVKIQDILRILESIKDRITLSLAELLKGELLTQVESIEISEETIEDAINILEKIMLDIREDISEEEYSIHMLERRRAELKLRYERVKAECEQLLDEYMRLEEAKREYDEIRKRYGDYSQITKNIENLQMKLRVLERRRDISEALLKVLESVKEELGERGKMACPVCDSQLSIEDVKKVRRKIEQIRSGRISGISEYENIKARLRELEEVRERILSLKRRLARYDEVKDILDELKKEADEKLKEIIDLEETISNKKQALEAIKRTIQDVKVMLEKARRLYEVYSMRKKIEYLQHKLYELEEKEKEYEPIIKEKVQVLGELKYIESRLSSIDKEILSLEKEINEIRRLISEAKTASKEYAILKVKYDAIKDLYERVMQIRELFRRIQPEVRERLLSKMITELNKVFRKIYPYGDYIELKISIEPSGRIRIVGVYEIYAKRSIDGSLVPIVSRLSDGQKIIVALSLILTVSKISKHKLNILMLDEPAPNIDLSCRRALIKMLSSSPDMGQILIATQSEEYKEIVSEELSRRGLKGVVYRVYWTREGSKVEVERYVK